MIIGLTFLLSGIVFASLPKVTLKCDGQNCVLYKNYFGQVIRAKYKFQYTDVQRCEVQPVRVIANNGQVDTKTFTLRLIGDNIPYTPEWVKKDPEGLSSICWDFMKKNPIKYSDVGFLNLLKNLWFVFAIAGLLITAAAWKIKRS